MVVKPVRDPHLHTALGPKHILAQAGMLLAGTLAVVNRSIPKPARKCRILVSPLERSTCLLDTAPGNSHRARMEGTTMVVLSMSGLVRCQGCFAPPVGTLKYHMKATVVMAVMHPLETRMPIPRGHHRPQLTLVLVVTPLEEACLGTSVDSLISFPVCIVPLRRLDCRPQSIR